MLHISRLQVTEDTLISSAAELTYVCSPPFKSHQSCAGTPVSAGLPVPAGTGRAGYKFYGYRSGTGTDLRMRVGPGIPAPFQIYSPITQNELGDVYFTA
jgi:hypothetical protein